jgi:hypothetical protein
MQKKTKMASTSTMVDCSLRIRIRIHVDRLDPDPHWEYGSGSRRAKMTHQSEENSSFEVVVDVFF